MNQTINNKQELSQESLEKNNKKIEIEYHPHGIYYVIPSQIMDSPNLSALEKLCYALLSGLANEYGTCFPSDKYLANRLGVSKETIKRTIKKFTDLKLISKYTDRSNMIRAKRIITILNICPSKNDSNVRHKNDHNDRVTSDHNDRVTHDPLESKEELESKDKESKPKKVAPASNLKEKLKGRANHVDTTDSEHEKLEEKYGKEMRDWCYQRLSDWKIDTPKGKWKKCDYRSMIRWVADAYLEQKKKDERNKKENSYEVNKELASKIATNFNYSRAKDKGIKIEALNKAIEFVFLKSQKNPIIISYSEQGFKEQMGNLMRKLRLI